MSYVAGATIGMTGVSALLVWIAFTLKEEAIFQVKDKTINASEFRPLFLLLGIIFMFGGLSIVRSLIIEVGVSNTFVSDTLIWFIISMIYLLLILLAFMVIKLVIKIISLFFKRKDVMDKGWM